ncbi:hypothetical protein BDW22DRAFT_1034756 [Trametopsis cervina]|nr:hypothetical protein BDW22DRAFT_1034756 [Trametopsis cervina]
MSALWATIHSGAARPMERGVCSGERSPCFACCLHVSGVLDSGVIRNPSVPELGCVRYRTALRLDGALGISAAGAILGYGRDSGWLIVRVRKWFTVKIS